MGELALFRARGEWSVRRRGKGTLLMEMDGNSGRSESMGRREQSHEIRRCMEACGNESRGII